MKLVLMEYLASLREREELDAVLPDLLSQMGLNVFSRPGRGTRQNGVDVAATGSLDDGEEKVFLFSIKPGDLRRSDWNGPSPQSLRPSLDEILDVYIRNRLPHQLSKKKIVVCICVGGVIREEVRENIKAYTESRETEQVKFEEWNGDKLAYLVESFFLREELLPKSARSRLRKSLALIDEPEASYKHFAILSDSIIGAEFSTKAERIRAIRQISICLWILFAWAREQGNVESAYLSSELLLLRIWHIARDYAGKSTKEASAVTSVFFSIQNTFLSIGKELLSKTVLPHSSILHGISSAVSSPIPLDVNLKLFDLAGRTALHGLWLYWCSKSSSSNESLHKASKICSDTLQRLIRNNPILLLPIKDDQCIDIALVVLLWIMHEEQNPIRNWLGQILDRAVFAYSFHKLYPCNIRSYNKLLEHPQHDEAYRLDVTAGSILYPFIAIVAAMMEDQELFEKVKNFKHDDLQHCNFQYWFPNDSSENHFYSNDESHGASLSGIKVEATPDELLQQVFAECNNMKQYHDLSSIKHGIWPLLLTACRHYRLPVPLHMFQQYWVP